MQQKLCSDLPLADKQQIELWHGKILALTSCANKVVCSIVNHDIILTINNFIGLYVNLEQHVELEESSI